MPLLNTLGGSSVKAVGGVGGSAIPPPVNTVAPVVSGSEFVGSTLSTTNGTWTSDESISFSYQWVNNTDGDISGATSSTYVLQATDDGDTIKCRVTATILGSISASADSNSTGTIQVAGQQAFTNGTYSWTAPSGVSTVAAVAIGSGTSGGLGGPDSNGNSNGGAGGQGGSLVYNNSISVTPGASYAVTVGQNSQFQQLATTGPAQAPTGGTGFTGQPGGPGGNSQGSGAPGGPGGGAANYDSNGNTNSGTGHQGNNQGPYGKGGNGGRGGCFGPGSSGQAGQQGAVRIIWGSGREYPGNATSV